MAKPVSAKVDVCDIELVTEYLVRLAYSEPRAVRDRVTAAHLISSTVQRRAVLAIADAVERLSDESGLNYLPADFCDRVRAVCADLEGVILKTLNDDAKKRMRTAVRQKRHQNKGWYDEISRAYERKAADLAKAAENQQALDL